MTANRDTAIWAAASENKNMDLASMDARSRPLPEVQTNYRPALEGEEVRYLYGEEAVERIHVADGYEIQMFASEVEFPELANPVQMTFDNKGRLWVAVMPSYPHYRPGDDKPNDKLLIFEDTDGDGKADNVFVFADSLHLPIGFSLEEEGVYLSRSEERRVGKECEYSGDRYAEKER